MEVLPMKTYNWGVLGCGVIANELAVAMKNHNKKALWCNKQNFKQG